MYYYIPALAYVRRIFEASNSNKKKFAVVPSNFLDNVFVVVFDDKGDHAYITKKEHYNEIPFGPFSDASGITLYAFLKPNFRESKIVNGNPHFIFDIGLGDGTGKDFTGTMAAELHFAFLPSTGGVTPHGSYNVDDFPGYVFQDAGNKDWLLTFENSIFGTAPVNNKTCKIRILKDVKNKKYELEKSVEICIFDSNGNLQHLLNTDNDNEIIIDYPKDGFQMLCMIHGSSSQSGKIETATFSIGDPRTDAVVTVTEEDV